MKPRIKRIPIIRYSIKYAKDEVRDGGTVLPKPGGGAWVYNSDKECLAYLTKRDYLRYCDKKDAA